jgi:hypothetical protein
VADFQPAPGAVRQHPGGRPGVALQRVWR